MTGKSDDVVKALEMNARQIGRSIIPICRRQEGGGGWEHAGSAFVLTKQEHWFAITAAHTLDGRRQYAIWGPSGWANIDLGSCVPPLSEVPDDLDVVSIPLTGEMREQCGLADAINDVVQIGYPAHAAPSYIMMGHPISHTKLRDAQKLLTTELAVATGAAVNDFDGENFDDSIHLAITYDVEAFRLLGGGPTKGPKPVGMSGGPLLYPGLTNKGPGVTFQLAGVLTRYNEGRKILIGTRWTAILDG